MIGQQKKMRLDEIQVKSFVTALSEDELLNTLRGGTDDEADDTADDSAALEARPRRKKKTIGTFNSYTGCPSPTA